MPRKLVVSPTVLVWFSYFIRSVVLGAKALSNILGMILLLYSVTTPVVRFPHIMVQTMHTWPSDASRVAKSNTLMLISAAMTYLLPFLPLLC
jgi:hypothetical protein